MDSWSIARGAKQWWGDRARGELVIERQGAPPIAIPARFAGIDGPTLAQRIVATKRKAAMNLLH
jgi:hypothetical protein